MATLTATIMAGGEFDSPPDTPSSRLDTEGAFSFVGALEISNGTSSYKGSAVAISRKWVITAGHHADLNDDGLADTVWSGNLHLALRAWSSSWSSHSSSSASGFTFALSLR